MTKAEEEEKKKEKSNSRVANCLRAGNKCGRNTKDIFMGFVCLYN
jgi:hypothetical protein